MSHDQQKLARLRAERARAGLHAKRNPGDPAARAAVAAAVDAYREAKLAAYIEDLVDKAPPLSDEARARLALLLRSQQVA